MFQTPGPETLELPTESAGEPTTESSVTEDYMHYQYQTQLTDTLRAMTDRLAALSVPPPPPTPPAPAEPSTSHYPQFLVGISCNLQVVSCVFLVYS